MNKEIDILKEEGGIIHTDKLEELIGRDEWDIKDFEEQPIKCVYCNKDWTPKMLEIYIESGYCETCYNTDRYTFIACENCGKIVYKKEV